MSIFVQITSYRNPDLTSTILDCYNKSKNKSDLSFGVCWQKSPEEQLGRLPSEIKIKLLQVPFQESLGLGWARNQSQSLYGGEDYVLQIDAGFRFIEDWDEILIKMISSLNSDKAIISSIPANIKNINENIVYRSHLSQFIGETPRIFPMPLDKRDNLYKARVLSDFFIFSKGSFCLDCKYDPSFYFSELDFFTTINAFANGYELYHPNKTVAWKDYLKIRTYWDDDPNWFVKDLNSKLKFKELITKKEEIIKKYEKYSGINFKEKAIHKSVMTGIEPPIEYQDENNWRSNLLKDHLLTVSWDKNSIDRCDDYNFWFFGIEDSNGELLWRQDLNYEKDKNILDFNVNYKKIYFKLPIDKKPSKLCVWPNSKSKGWLRQSKFEL